MHIQHSIIHKYDTMYVYTKLENRIEWTSLSFYQYNEITGCSAHTVQ